MFRIERRSWPVAAAALGLLLTAGTANTDAAETKPPAPEQPTAPAPPPPYEDQMLRLSQVLGSVAYLRQLCGTDQDNAWRATMQKLIDTETAGEPEQAKRLTAAFNRGYRSFASVYVSCTESAVAAEQNYRREGATLARKIAAKYGN